MPQSAATVAEVAATAVGIVKAVAGPPWAAEVVAAWLVSSATASTGATTAVAAATTVVGSRERAVAA